jgi:hypothetical protein
MKKFLLLPISGLLLSCGGTAPTESKPAPIKVAKLSVHETLLRKVKLNDTLTPGGTALKYAVDSNNRLVITLETKKFKRSFSGSDLPQQGSYLFKNEWTNFVGLRNTCGNSCWTLSLLPLTRKGPVKNYDYDIASDTKHDLLFGKKSLEGNEYYVANIRTAKKKKIVLTNLFGQGLPGNGIDSVSFVKEGLFVKWEVVSGGKGKGKSRSEVFKYKI